MSFHTIDYRVVDDIGILQLNRPDSLNSFNREMHAEVREVFAQIRERGNLRCLVLTGAGRGFCAGQDLQDRKFDPDNPPDLGESLEQNYNPLIHNITSLPMPVICAVNGVAAGAGAGIALACDIVLAARSAVFIFSFAKVGLGMDCGSSWSLPRLVGLPRARALAMLGEKLSAEKAEQWGLIWKCVDDENLQQETLGLANHLARQPTAGLATIKKELLASAANTLEAQLDLEAELQRIAGRSEDYREGVMAFLQKRPPVFKGR